MTHQVGRVAAVAAWRDVCRRSAPSVISFCLAMSDVVLGLLIVLAALMAWSPLIGIGAARQAIAARRERRSTIIQIRHAQGEIWARQAQRNSAVGLAKFSAVTACRSFDH
ncbi:MAG: hypothetical protein E6G81_08050 [Alphaproteobacteria bacterium]|nr:MAG: hypothetical protein E6G81_08050 [Alphaproteobacteria bacterium]